MNTIDEMISVLDAYKNGKTIEIKAEFGGWAEFNKMSVILYGFNFKLYEYRIKPQLPEHKYRPYKSAEEVLNDIMVHGSMCKTPSGAYWNICYVQDECISFNDNKLWKMKDAFEHIIWADNTIFGKEE